MDGHNAGATWWVRCLGIQDPLCSVWAPLNQRCTAHVLCAPNDEPNQAEGHPLVIRGHAKTAIFQPNHVGLGPIGRPVGYREIEPGTPTIGQGVHIDENSSMGSESGLT